MAFKTPKWQETRRTAQTWNGRPGEHYCILAGCSPLGMRISIIEWTDGSKQVDIKLIQGDGRKPGFKLFKEFLNIPVTELPARIKELKELAS